MADVNKEFLDLQGLQTYDEKIKELIFNTATPKTATDSFKTINGGLLDKLLVKFEPVQDLHGYDKPWAGGANKNLLPLVVDTIKAANTETDSSWSGDEYTWKGVTYSIQKDNAGNVTGIKLTGANTSSSVSSLVIPFYWVENTDYIFNGCASGGSSNSYRIDVYDETDTLVANIFDYGTGNTYTPSASGTGKLRIRIAGNYTFPTEGLMFYPMIRLATVQDSTFEPYANICPITPHTQSQVLRTGTNLAKSVVIMDSVAQYISTLFIDTEEDLLPNTQYTISFKNDGGVGNILYTNERLFTSDTSVTVQNGVTTVTVTTKDVIDRTSGYQYIADKGWVIFKNRIAQSAITVYKDVQLEKGSQATSYEPYKGQLYTLQLGQDVYSAYVDFISGEMTIVGGVVDLGSLPFTYNPSWGGGGVFSIASSLPNIKAPSSGSIVVNALCEIYKIYSRDELFNSPSVDGYAVAASGQLVIRDHRFTDAPSFRSAMSGIKMVYELATPTSLTLTGQSITANTGINNVSAPLNGQEIDTNGIEYKELFPFNDVMRVTDSMLTRDGVDITSNLANLSAAISEQNLYKYGYSIGDYFIGASGYKYYIADMDTYYGGYDFKSVVSTHHAGIVVVTGESSKYLDSGTLVGYSTSTLHEYLTGTVLTNIKSDLTALFGSWNNHLLSHEKLYNTVNGNSGWSSDQYISALTENQVYGSWGWGMNPYQQGEGILQLDIFRKYRFNKIFGDKSIWLRSLSSDTLACCANDEGIPWIGHVTQETRYVVGLILFK